MRTRPCRGSSLGEFLVHNASLCKAVVKGTWCPRARSSWKARCVLVQGPCAKVVVMQAHVQEPAQCEALVQGPRAKLEALIGSSEDVLTRGVLTILVQDPCARVILTEGIPVGSLHEVFV